MNPTRVASFTQALCGDWELAPSIDDQWRFHGLHRAPLQPVGAFARTRWIPIPAHVPGGVHADLLRAGVIADFRQGMNSLEAEWVGARQWVYRRTFQVQFPEGGRRWLRLDGVDWTASVFLNGALLGRALVATPVTQIGAVLEGSRLTLTNTGPAAASWLSLQACEDGVGLFSDNGFTLLPGEFRELGIQWRGLTGQPLSCALTVEAVNVTPLRLQGAALGSASPA